MPIDPSSNLYYETEGPSKASTIVLLHGGGVGGWMWRKQVQALKSDYHCLVPDLPEQGKSTTPNAGRYSTEGAADAVATLIRSQAHGGRAHIAGLSEGAQVVVALLSRAPEVIDHALVSSAIMRSLWVNSLYPPWLVALSYRWFMAPLKNNDWWIRLNMRGSAGIPDEYYDDFKTSFQTTTESGLVNMMSAALKFRMPPGLDKTKMPVLVVVGSKEYSAMKESAQDLVRVLPKARGVVVSLGSKSSLVKEHNWAVTAPELFTATLKAWIENCPLPAQLLPLAASARIA